MNLAEYNQNLFTFIKRSPTQFHTVSEMVHELKKNNFIALDEQDKWELKKGKKYFVTRNGSSIVAFVMGVDTPAKSGIKIAGAHTDSPCLKVKPLPELKSDSMLRIGVEVYGGALLTTWFDRELNLAGKVTCIIQGHNKPEKLENFFINYNRPVAVIPSIAIHLERNSGTNKNINPQSHIQPVFLTGNIEKAPSFNKIIEEQIKKEYPNAVIKNILGFDLNFSDITKPCFLGLNNELISAPRLDNLISCHACLESITNLKTDNKHTSLIICSDNEETGSNTREGAKGSFLESVLFRISGSSENFFRAAARSLIISVDNAHAIHPSYMEKYDENHLCRINHGPVIKINASGKYTSNAETSAILKFLCKKAGIPFQIFVMRNDMPCGSTIGPYISSKTGIKAVDIGAPTLAMHSIRELTGNKDPLMIFNVLNEFFNFDKEFF